VLRGDDLLGRPQQAHLGEWRPQESRRQPRELRHPFARWAPSHQSGDGREALRVVEDGEVRERLAHPTAPGTAHRGDYTSPSVAKLTYAIGESTLRFVIIWLLDCHSCLVAQSGLDTASRKGVL